MRVFTHEFSYVPFGIPAISMSIFSLSKSECYFPLADFVLHRVAKIFYNISWIVRALRLVNLADRILQYGPPTLKLACLRALFQDKEI